MQHPSKSTWGAGPICNGPLRTLAAGLLLAFTLCSRAAGADLLWSSNGQPAPGVMTLLESMRNAEDRGLDPADYDTQRLGSLLAQARAARDATSASSGWAQFDRAMSLNAGRFVSDLHFGRIDPATIGHHLTIDRVALDLPAALRALAAAPSVAALLDGLEPGFEHFALLKGHLARYRELARDPSLTKLPPLPAQKLRSLESYEGAAQLERLLSALGDWPSAAPDPLPHALALSQALRRFQRRHGLKPDGTLGAATFAELTRPLSARVRQIELTLERFRWLPHKLPTAPIVVNIPQFHLYAFASANDSEQGLVQMDVIVGKAFQATQTPVFTADMSYLVFRPYWDVPIDIARKEIVPAARRDPSSLERNHLEIVRAYDAPADAALPPSAANLDLAAHGVLRIRQRPGPDNALGLVKFMLPNPYDVYLHSTPAKALFEQSRRAFSHGCVRVSDPVGLAEYVLRDSPQWNRERILTAMNATQSLVVHLPHPIRVYIVYGTALATEPGDVLFFDDIYGQDERLEQALRARRAATASAAAL